jgi:16S rRNA G966 N2-methylase RsmD
LDAEERFGLLRGRLPAALERLPPSWPRSFDLIFADPPYDFDADDELLRGAAPVLAVGGELVLEHAARRTVAASAGLMLLERRQYGETALSIFAAESGS